MHRLMVCATLACAVLAAACSSSTSPKPGPFTGTYVGSWSSSSTTDTAHMSQSGNTITARDSEWVNTNLTGAVNFNGSVTGSAMTFTITSLSGDTTYGTFKGTYSTPSQVSGYYYPVGSPTDSETLTWTRQ